MADFTLSESSKLISRKICDRKIMTFPHCAYRTAAPKRLYGEFLTSNRIWYPLTVGFQINLTYSLTILEQLSDYRHDAEFGPLLEELDLEMSLLRDLNDRRRHCYFDETLALSKL